MSGKSLLIFIGALSLGACASTPDVNLQYYPTVTEVDMTVKQWLTCDPDDTAIFTAAVPIYGVKHHADMSGISLEKYRINPSNFDSALKNADVTISFYEDGRLKGVNTNIVGQGQEVLQGVGSLAGTLFGLPGFTFSTESVDRDASKKDGPLKAACDVINGADVSKRNAILELIYSKKRKISSEGSASITLEPDSRSIVLIAQLTRLGVPLGPVEVDVSEMEYLPKRVVESGEVSGENISIALRRASKAMFTPKVTFNGSTRKLSGSPIIFVGENSADDLIPIPKGAAFGTSTFELALSEAGTIQSIKYGNSGSSSAFLGAANSLAGAINPESETAKEQADRIAQEQRLLRCQADPATCT